MVAVTNDVVPWYGEVQSYEAGMYAVRVGGTEMVVAIDEKFVKLHPALKEQRANAIKGLKAGSIDPALVRGFDDFLGSKAHNRLCDAIVGGASQGTILTVCNGNALMTLMWPSMAPVVVVDNDESRIACLRTLIEMAGTAKGMLDWQCEVYKRYGSKLLDLWVNRHRPIHQNFLALKQCAGRVTLVLQDLSAEDAVLNIAKTCSQPQCLENMCMIYASNIENYLQPGNVISKPAPGALRRFKANILSLMQAHTRVISGATPTMREPLSREAFDKVLVVPEDK
jgi:hypothetical protein